jgi:hypothetical protein
LTTAIKTTAIFLKPFELASFNETLPAGDYEIEVVLKDPVDGIGRGNETSCVLVHLQARTSHPGLSRTLTVPLAELDLAAAKDKLTGKALTDFFLEDKLSDPMIRMFMQADAVSEADVRGAYSGRGHRRAGANDPKRVTAPVSALLSQAAMSPRWGSSRPGIGE